MDLFSHPDFVGFRDDGACIWRRRPGHPDRKGKVPQPTAGSVRVNQLGIMSGCSTENNQDVNDIKSFRIGWLVSKSNASRSLAALVADLYFETFSD